MTTARDRPPEEAAEDTSFARGLRLLLMVADRGEIRADELSSLLEMPLSTVYRYLRTLGDFGFVDRHGGQFRLGPKLLIGTGANVSSERLIRHADAALRMLADETGETAVVVRRIGLSSICLHQIESDEPLRVTLEPGAMSPLYAGAPGRVLLAFAPTEVLDEVLAQDLLRITRTDPDRGRVAREPRRDRHDRDGHQRGRVDRGLGRDGRPGLPGGRDRRRDRAARAGVPMRRGLAGAGRPTAPGGGPRRQRGPRGRPDSLGVVLLSRIVADRCLMVW